MTRVFSYLKKDNIPAIGVEWSPKDDSGNIQQYDFSRAWELFDRIKLKNNGPQLTFVQMMVELSIFQAETFDEVFTTIEQYKPLSELVLAEKPHYQPPIQRPQKILCIGRNYSEHAKELDHPIPKEPIFFSKSSSAMIAHEQTIHLPENVGRIEHEAELAVVIGKTGKNIPENKVDEHIAGYTILNDITAREMQKKDIAASLPWYRSKNFDGFCPVGPYLVPRNSITDPHKLKITLTVNDEVRQQGNTADMIFSIPEVVSYLSRYCTLAPGDIIATGTPSGVGIITSGDKMVTSVSGLGDLVNPIE